MREINDPSPNSSRAPSYANAESRSARNASSALIPCAQREDFDENLNPQWHEPVSDVQESYKRQHTMSSSRRFVENRDFTTIPTTDLLRLVSVYINISFHILILFQLHPGKPSLWTEQQCFDSLYAEGHLRQKFKSSMTRACLGYNPP